MPIVSESLCWLQQLESICNLFVKRSQSLNVRDDDDRCGVVSSRGTVPGGLGRPARGTWRVNESPHVHAQHLPGVYTVITQLFGFIDKRITQRNWLLIINLWLHIYERYKNLLIYVIFLWVFKNISF